MMDATKKEFSEFIQTQLAKPSNSLFSKKRIELIRKYLLGGKYIKLYYHFMHGLHTTELSTYISCNCLNGLLAIGSYAWISSFLIHAESDDDITTRLRQFSRDKQFELRNFSTYGLENVLVVPRRKNNQVQTIRKIVLLEHILHV